ncbi:MAG: hypothetical protein ACOX1P_23150 [Thermoguttaceae bacterium]
MATKDDAAARFVALQWAVQLAAEGKDGETALAAAEALSEGYEMAVGEIKVAIFQRLAAQSRSVEEYTALARDAMDTARQVADSDEFIAARQLGEIAVDMARAARNGELVRQVRQAAKEIERLAEARAVVEAALRVLKAEPDDPASNLAAGRYFCLVREDWDRGLPLLARGSDESLKEAAAADLAGADSAETQAKLGNRWWELAEIAPEAERSALRARALHWFRQAAPNLTGLTKAWVDRQIATAEEDTALPLLEAPMPGEVTILHAVYGGRTKVVDVTEKVQQAYARDKFAPIQADHRVFGDPIPGNQKELDLLFRYNVRRVSLRLSPQQVVVLPPVAPGGTRVPDASREFRIVAARYGAGLTWIDVTEPLKTALEDPTKPLKLDGRWAGKDPWHGIQKRFAVWFDYRGRRFVRLVPADESVIFLPGK